MQKYIYNVRYKDGAGNITEEHLLPNPNALVAVSK